MLNHFPALSFFWIRRVEINGKIFNICINRNKKTIRVQGSVEDWDEKDMVEKYFRLKSPSDYKVDYEIKILSDC